MVQRIDNLGTTVLYGKCAGKTARGLTKVKHKAKSFKPSRSLSVYTFLSDLRFNRVVKWDRERT